MMLLIKIVMTIGILMVCVLTSSDDEFEEDHDMSSNTRALFKIAEEFCKDQDDYETADELIKGFVDRVRTLDADSTDDGEEIETENESEAVTVSTIHQSKGLEWEHVIIVRTNKGICPINFRFEHDPREKRDSGSNPSRDETEQLKRKLAADHMAEEVSTNMTY
jgi:superfamily I DNA/RNA helicase